MTTKKGGDILKKKTKNVVFLPYVKENNKIKINNKKKIIKYITK